jgi:hypothetical protein
MFTRASGLVYHFEKNQCPSITATRFHGYLQHKGIILKLLEDPTMMEQMALKDYFQYQDAAKDEDKEGGVVLDMLDDDTSTVAGLLMEPMVPEKVEPKGLLLKQQGWPTLAAAVSSSVPSLDLAANMEALSIKHGGSQWSRPKRQQELKVEANPWPLPDEYKKGGALPVAPPAWSAGSTSKDLFPGATQTPISPDWDALLRAKEEKDHKSNLFHHQFWNPAHEDYDAERFYDPMIEKYKCPLPGCE